jgi:hypothetical protein
VNRRRYRVRSLHAYDGERTAWCVFREPAGNGPSMVAGWVGPFARLRARFRAASLNRKGW